MLISVIIPVYGAPNILPVLYERLVASLSPWTDFELIMVNDCCPHGSGLVLAELAGKDSRVKAIDLIRNFGQHTAITAGLDYAHGDYAVVMDCDLQDQPEEIKKMYDYLTAGQYEGVFGARANRQHSLLKRLESKIFFVILRSLNAEYTPKQYKNIGNFSIITKKMVQAYRLYREKERLYSAIIERILPRIGVVDIQHSSRYEGTSSYSFNKRLALALNAVVANSTKPLTFAIYGAFFTFAIAAIIGIKTLISYLLFNTAISGWIGLALLICFFSGLQMLFLGILGVYLGETSTAVKQRPLYIVDKTINI